MKVAMTSLQKDISIQSQRPNGNSFVVEFGSSMNQEEEEGKSEIVQEEIIENNMMNEEELVKSEAQDEIGGELFPCCKLCENPEKLFFHIKQHHEKDATKCVLCGRELSSKSSLDRHLLIHAKWQPYKCSHCNKQFSTNGNMHRHKKTHKGLCKGSKFSPIKSSEKRRRNADETSENEQPVKKMKLGCKENTKSVCENITDTENKTVALDIKTYPLSPESQPDVNAPVDDKVIETLQSVPSSPSKEEFITTLGLKTACRLENKAESSGASSSQSVSPIDNVQLHENEHVVPESSISVEDVKEQSTKKETLIKLPENETVNKSNLTKVHTVTSQVQIGQSEPPFKEIVQVTKGNVDRVFNNVGRHWLPESPETSIEGNFFDVVYNPESLDECEEDKLQPRYVCQHCKKEFKKKIIFQKHLMKHNKQKPFKCTICGAKLLSKQNATRHVVKVHKKRRMQAKLLIVENLDDAPSSGTKTLCEWCGQEFTSSLILEHHKRASTGCQAKPFICLICNKSFSTKNNGKRHQFKHHKDEQADCCIVRNAMAKNSGDGNPLSRIMDSSTSTSSIAYDEAPQESSVESLLSSESEHPDDSELSLPKKELDAAQSLIDMFSSLPPPRSSGDERIIDQTDINSSPPTQDNSCFYLHIPVNVQNKPLDLSVHPMDLSSKSNEESGKLRAHEFRRLPVFTFPISYKDRSSDTGIFLANERNCISSETPLNLVKKKEHSCNNHFNSSLHPSVSFPPNSFESSSHTSMEIDDSSQKECNSPKSNVSYECHLCSMSFSTNSNKRRHEKTKHLMHCKVPQISPGFFNTKEKQMTSTPKYVLSKKTKEALITKVSSLKSVEFEPVDFSVNNSVAAANQPLAIISNESENGDLASVSSLISTANSPQLKKYLTADNACDVTASESSKDEKEDSPKAVDQSLGSAKSSGKHWCAVCKKQFTCKSSFNRHSVIHTKKRDHHCQECKKTFTTKSNRDRHMKKVHRLVLSRDNKKLVSSRKQQKKTVTLVPTESPTTEVDVKDSPLPKELVNSEISQCNKENQRLFMPS
ncbi:zinc finger protein 236 isoform X1 [Parasteatoda tepidariorum]|uniref:zinc finger protein 236 isoform X1 n=2 Tax=Parasteatoda tepidariorum TaxID=114398 RepID=UPI001C71F94C|nr:ras-responsive element-binding protein 1 isoform X1 [Parasteatoda tepidariorum]